MTSFISNTSRRRPGNRAALVTVQVVTLIALIIVGLGPLFWAVKGAVSPPTELITDPLALWPSEPRFENFATVWTDLQIGHFLLNTFWIVLGSWAGQLFIAITAGFALSVLKPRFGPALYGAILATMFVPYTVSMVSLFLTVVDLPLLHLNIANTYWAIWLPSAANAFNVLIAKRFFDALPAELFDAARVDGANTWQLLTRIVMPMSRPVIAVISLLAVMHSWKDFIWPLVAITDPQKQPIAVALSVLSSQAPQDQLIAAMVLALLPPVLLYLVFQRYVVDGLGFTGVKG